MSHIAGPIQVANSLRSIRDEKLYLDAGYATFDDYCCRRWGITAELANRTIDALDRIAVATCN